MEEELGSNETEPVHRPGKGMVMKRRWTGLVALAVLAGCSSEAYAEYDCFRNIQSPVKRRQDVSLDKIKPEGGPRAQRPPPARGSSLFIRSFHTFCGTSENYHPF